MLRITTVPCMYFIQWQDKDTGFWLNVDDTEGQGKGSLPLSLNVSKTQYLGHNGDFYEVDETQYVEIIKAARRTVVKMAREFTVTLRDGMGPVRIVEGRRNLYTNEFTYVSVWIDESWQTEELSKTL